MTTWDRLVWLVTDPGFWFICLCLTTGHLMLRGKV